MKKRRLDTELVLKGKFKDADKASRFIMAGEVFINGNVTYRRDHKVSDDDVIEIRKKHEYVSRGAYKLKNALSDFGLEITGKRIVDIGISNGGFSNLLLESGAAGILGVDVNTDQVDYKLRNDPRVGLLKKNARYLVPGDIGFQPDLIVMDVSFISVIRILEALRAFGSVDIVSLIKPQFEVKRSESVKGGVIKDREKIAGILLDVKHQAEKIGFGLLNFTRAGITGKKGNQEYFFFLKYGKINSIDDKIIRDEI